MIKNNKQIFIISHGETMQLTMQRLKALNNLVKKDGPLLGNVGQRTHHRHKVNAAHIPHNIPSQANSHVQTVMSQANNEITKYTT
jgi:hypothetical protein